MAMRVRRIPADALGSVSGCEWVDRTRRPFVSGETAYVPVSEGHPCDESLQSRPAYRGRGYYMIGPVAVIRGERPDPGHVRDIVDWKNPRAVIWIGNHADVERFPVAEVLYGEPGEVIHRESGISYCLDPTRVMFSQGNRNEKERIARLVRPGERIADMYAGIGYFTLPAAKAGGFIHAIEINPVAFDYLVRNIAMNCVAKNVTAECGDSRLRLSGVYDRIIMGHFDSPDSLGVALDHVEPGSVIHVHSSGRSPPDLSTDLSRAGINAEILVTVVKKTAPRCVHYVQDVVIS